LAKVAKGTLEKFQGTHILGASRGYLCGSSAFLLFQATATLTYTLNGYVRVAACCSNNRCK